MNNTKKLVNTLTWAASSDVQVDLPTDGIITRIDLECYITMSGAASANIATWALFRAIQSLKIQGGGGRDYFNMSGVQMGMLMHYMNALDFPGVPFYDIVATSQYAGWTLHFGSRPRDQYGRDNPFDLTAGIPADDETNLKLTWTTAAANSMDDTLTISSAVMRVTVHQVLAPKGTMEALKNQLYVPISSSESCDPGATKSALSYQRNVPTGGYLRRILVMAQDDTAVGSFGPLVVDGQVSEFGLKLEKENRWIIDGIRAKAIQLANPAMGGMSVVDTPNTNSPWAPAGFYNLDLRKYGDRDFGIPTTGLDPGDIKLAMTIAAYATGEVEQVWYDTLIPYRRF